MQVIHTVTKRIIDVPSDHFANVLSNQGWEKCKESEKLTAVLDIPEPTIIEKAGTIIKEKAKRGRPKKITKTTGVLDEPELDEPEYERD